MRIRRTYILLTCCSLVLLTYLFTGESEKVSDSESVNRVKVNPESYKEKRIKNILLWGHLDGTKKDFYFFGSGQEAFRRNKCRIQNCFVTDDRTMLPVDQYDAILFHIGYMKKVPPKMKRSEHQRYVYFNLEPPYRAVEHLELYNNYFNWTMTYRNDSDIQFPYGKIVPLETAPKNLEESRKRVEMYSIKSEEKLRKKKSAIWFVSNCKTPGKREKLVRKLQKWIPVDIYGKCGVYKCQRRSNQMPDCYKHMEDHYKFYFSFENSLAKNYVTEKFFRVLDYDIVPVVYGSEDYDSIAPYHSFIDARKFSPEGLARYLVELGANQTRYDQYFWWKEHYKVLHYDDDYGSEHPFCKLCEKLNNEPDVAKKSYDIIEWEMNGSAV